MKQPLQQVFSLSAAADRRRRRRPAVIVAAIVLLWWTYLVLGSNLPWLLVAISGTAVAVWTLRGHRQVAACLAIAAATAAVPATTCVILMDRQATDAADLVAVLTGYILAAPIPTVVACVLRPALVTAPLNAACGSGVLLLGALPTVALGDHGEGPVLVVIALATSVAFVWHRHRRAAAALIAPLPLVNGWTDLGRRILPDGSRVEQLLVGSGHVIACSTATSATDPEEDSFAAVRTAAATATALGLSERKVQPVVLIEQDLPLQRILVNDGTLAASVIMTGSRQVEEVTRLAPRRHRQHRRVVLTAALLPVPAAEAATR